MWLNIFIPMKDIGFQIALKCLESHAPQDDQDIGGLNFQIEDLFVTRADGCTLYDTVPGVKSIFETPHPYIYDMECRENFHCKNAEYIHYRLHKIEINCQFKKLQNKPKPFYLDTDFLKIDNKGKDMQKPFWM